MIVNRNISDLSKLLSFLGNEQRLKIIRSIAEKEKYAKEISEEIGISRPLVNIYLKQLEKEGLVMSVTRVEGDQPYLKKYYVAVPFELIVNLDIIKNRNGESV